MESPDSTNSSVNGVDRIRAFLVLAATIGTIAFNVLASFGYVNGVTPAQISDQYPSVITPAGYAFSIWSLIYIGLSIFSIHQLLPANIARYRPIRSLYILSCATNCAWIFFWHSDQIGIALGVIVVLLIVLFAINSKLPQPGSAFQSLVSRGTFGIYAGWVSAATLVNAAIYLVYMHVPAGSGSQVLGAALILFAAAIGVAARVRLGNFYVPFAIAWALTAIAVKQSGNTLVVSAAAVGVIACLIASLSFVLNLSSHE